MKKLSFNKVFFFMFAITWFVLVVVNMFKPVKKYSETENRYLASFPEFTVETLLNGGYMASLEEYLNDQFVFRDKWIAMKIMAERAMLKTDSNSVFFGKDDYLIEKHDNVNEEHAYRNQDYLVSFVNRISEKLGSDRISVMLVPTASEILKDKLPLFATVYDQTKFNNDLMNKLPSGTYIDVKDTLLSHKNEYIYYRTDHHWTSLGAYYAYEQWVNEIGFAPIPQEEFEIEKVTNEFLGTLHSKVNISVKPDDIFIYKIKKDMDYELLYNNKDSKDSLFDFDALNTKDKYSVYMGGNNALVTIKTNVDNGRKLLVIKDSYAHCFVPFAVNHFEETHMIDFRHFNLNVEQYIVDNGITDVLVLYNTMGFINDSNIIKMSDMYLDQMVNP